MADIEVYVCEGENGELDPLVTLDALEAQEYARRHGLRVIAREYEYTDSDLVWDYSHPTMPDNPGGAAEGGLVDGRY